MPCSPRASRLGDVGDHRGLPAVVLPAVPVAGVDDDPTTQSRPLETLEGMGDVHVVVVRPGRAPSEDEVPVAVPAVSR